MITYDDVLIIPEFSDISSRSEVDTTSFGLKVPVISANMDTVTGVAMAKSMWENGGIGALHRFNSIESNVSLYQECPSSTYCSVGLGEKELDRAIALASRGCNNFILDVAHGAQMQVVEQTKRILDCIDAFIIVGNFANPSTIEKFLKLTKGYNIQAFKVGIGPGSACTTRIKTGVGVPQLTAVMECANVANVIADGGIKAPGDVCKALAAGAKAVMVGNLLASTVEAAGGGKYRGSASRSSYADQGKLDRAYITAEGEEATVQVNTTVKDVMADIEGGLRSSMCYVGARTIEEYVEKARFIQITTNTNIENRSRL